MMSKVEKHSRSILDDLLNEISPEELEKTKKRMLLASRIYDGIKAKGWKNKDFANALGKQPSEISKWLSGTHKFNSETLFDIERVLDINLFNLSDKPKEQVVVFRTQVQLKEETVLDTSSSMFESEKISDLNYVGLSSDVMSSFSNGEC